MSESATTVERAATRNACAAWTWQMEPRCASCGYDLRGCPNPRCPECGTAYEPVCPACDGVGRRVVLPPRGWLIVVLAINVQLTVLAVLGVLRLGWIFQAWTEMVAVVVTLAAPGMLFFFAVSTLAKRSECERCHGTGIDFEDRVWTGAHA